MSDTGNTELEKRLAALEKGSARAPIAAQRRSPLLALIVGLLVGSLLTTALSPTALQQLSITPAQIQALPAAVLLWLAALFLA